MMNEIEVLAPNFKRRLSGVTATIVRLIPLQAKQISICATGAGLPTEVPFVSMWSVLFMSRRGPSGPRVWHARRNVEILSGLILKHVLRKRIKLLFTSASQRQHTWMTRWLIRNMDHVIATSQKTASYLERPCTVILHGIDIETFVPAPSKQQIRQELGLPADAKIVGCFGRIRAQKGTDVFVDAMIETLKCDPNAYGIVMGRAVQKDKTFEAELHTRIAAAGLSERIVFPPEVPVWQIAKWYQALDVYVAPQRWEGFGLTPLEAMACAVPVIATRVGAFEEIVKDGETGALVEIADSTAIAGHLKALLNNAEQLQRYSTAARRHVEAQFSIEKEAAAIVAIYRSLLEQGVVIPRN